MRIALKLTCIFKRIYTRAADRYNAAGKNVQIRHIAQQIYTQIRKETGA